MERISVICADLGKLPLAALQYLVLTMNRLQQDVEFQFLPLRVRHGSLLATLKPGQMVAVDNFEALAETYVRNLPNRFAEHQRGHAAIPNALGRPVIVSLAVLDTHWYEVWRPEYSALFLGDWDTRMAPPSALESLVTLIAVEGILA